MFLTWTKNKYINILIINSRIRLIALKHSIPHD